MRYLATALLALMLFIVVLRIVVFVLFWVVGFDFWIFPNFFDESPRSRKVFSGRATHAVKLFQDGTGLSRGFRLLNLRRLLRRV